MIESDDVGQPPESVLLNPQTDVHPDSQDQHRSFSSVHHSRCGPFHWKFVVLIGISI